MPTSIVDPAFDLLNITRTGTLTNASDAGTDFNLNVTGSLSPTWAGTALANTNVLCLPIGGLDTYILASDVDWTSLLIQVPVGAKVHSLELRCNAAIDCTCQIIDQADLHNNVLAGTARQRITFTVEAPNAGAYTLTTDVGYVQNVATVSGVVSNYNISKVLSDASILLDKIWDFTGEPLGYITKADLITAFTHTQIKLLGWSVIQDAAILANSHTGNATLTASLQSNLWEMIIEWEESWTIISILPNPAKPGDTITITGTNLDLLIPLPDTLQWDDDAGVTHVLPILDATLIDNEHITFTMPPSTDAVPPADYIGVTVTIFSGSVEVGPIFIYNASGSGIYKITANKRNDTLYDRSTDPISTEDVKIPDPFAETGFIGG